VDIYEKLAQLSDEVMAGRSRKLATSARVSIRAAAYRRSVEKYKAAKKRRTELRTILAPHAANRHGSS